jgi:hypothetical protein
MNFKDVSQESLCRQFFTVFFDTSIIISIKKKRESAAVP